MGQTTERMQNVDAPFLILLLPQIDTNLQGGIPGNPWQSSLSLTVT